MKREYLLVLLTLVNLALLGYQAAGPRLAHADDDVIRGRGLEITDANGVVRVQVKVEPENKEFKMPDGTLGYPETVIFRLITADGKPRVKLTTSEEGSGLMLLGNSDTTHTLLIAEGEESSLKLRNNEATQQILKP